MSECFLVTFILTVHSPPNAIIGSSPHNSNPFPSLARPSHLKETRQDPLPLHPLPERKEKEHQPKHPWPWSCPATKSPDSAAYSCSEIVAQFFPGCRLLSTVTSIAPTHSFFLCPGSLPPRLFPAIYLHQTSIIYRSASEIDPSLDQLPNPPGSSDLIVLLQTENNTKKRGWAWLRSDFVYSPLLKAVW